MRSYRDKWFNVGALLAMAIAGALYPNRIAAVTGTLAGSAVLGGLAGLIAGYAGRWLDMGAARLVDVILSFPPILLGVVITGVLGTGMVGQALAGRLHELGHDGDPAADGSFGYGALSPSGSGRRLTAAMRRPWHPAEPRSGTKHVRNRRLHGKARRAGDHPGRP